MYRKIENNLKKIEIIVTMANNKWRAAVVYQGYTYLFNLLSNKINGKTLVIFLTYESNISISDLSNITDSKIINNTFTHVDYKTKKIEFEKDKKDDRDNYIIVDHLNSHQAISEFVEKTAQTWNQVLLVFDHIEVGGYDSVNDAMSFILSIEKITEVNIIFKVYYVYILVENIARILHNNKSKYTKSIVKYIFQKKIVEHHYCKELLESCVEKYNEYYDDHGNIILKKLTDF